MAYTKDDQHLQVLSICYWVGAGLSALGFALLTLYAILFGTMWPKILEQAAEERPTSEQPPEWLGVVVISILVFLAVFSLVLAVLQATAAVSIQRRKRRVFTMVIAGIQCVVSIPLGTVLGVFTFIILSRPSVRDLYEGRVPAPQPQALPGSTPPTVPPGML